MSKSTTNSKPAKAARGTGGATSQQPASRPALKPHQVIPEADFGGDDDEEEDDYQPRVGFTPKPAVTQTPAAVVPAQVSEPAEDVKPAVSQVIITEPSTPLAPHPEVDKLDAAAHAKDIADAAMEQPLAESSPVEAAPPAAQAIASEEPAVDPAESLVDPGASFGFEEQDSGLQVEAGTTVGTVQPTSDVPTWTPRYAPAVRTTGSVSVTAPSRRPGRRRPAESFNAEQPRQRNQAAGQELAVRAPRYASLLGVYSGGQLATLQFESRNINLYGLLADQVGAQVAADKALLKKLTKQRPRLTSAHYVDAALEPVLRPLDPEGTDLDGLDAERDYVWELAQRGNAYRKYIKSDQDSDSLPHYRAKIPLRADVNARFSRLIDVMDSMQGVPAKPYEIVSAVLAEYLIGLAGEVPALTEVFGKYTEVTTIQ